MNSPTERQSQVLAVIESNKVQTGKMPSLRTIAKSIGIRSRSAAFKHVHALKRKGLLADGKRRVRVIDDDWF